jgi:hypothetical protein
MGAKKAGKVTASSGRVYQLHIALRGIRPPVWRRVQVPGTLLLAGLHDVIQTMFGWTDSHLHQFFIGDAAYGRPMDFDEAVLDEAASTLAEAVGARVKRFTYVYDFGDDWVHDVAVEKLIAGNSGSERPLCIGGKRRRPREDCGGVPRYGDAQLDDLKIPLRVANRAALVRLSSGSEECAKGPALWQSWRFGTPALTR